MDELNEDLIVACADLVGRSGATDFEIGYLNDDPENPGWWAKSSYRGTRFIRDGHRTPEAACLALATRILSGATCRCLKTVALDDRSGGCRWKLVGQRWEPGCDDEPLRITEGQRGDYAALQAAIGNRAQRRAAARRRGGSR